MQNPESLKTPAVHHATYFQFYFYVTYNAMWCISVSVSNLTHLLWGVTFHSFGKLPLVTLLRFLKVWNWQLLLMSWELHRRSFCAGWKRFKAEQGYLRRLLSASAAVGFTSCFGISKTWLSAGLATTVSHFWLSCHCAKIAKSRY